MEWTEQIPEKEGLFAYQNIGYWPINIGNIKRGDWQLSQNPEELYIHGELLSQTRNRWYGPIPEPSK